MSPPQPARASRTCERCCAASVTAREGGARLCRVCFEHGSPEPTCAEERAWFPSLTGELDAPPCVVCGGGDDEDLVLLCDGPTCNRPFHARCVGFQGPVQGDWLCADCRPGEASKTANV